MSPTGAAELAFMAGLALIDVPDWQRFEWANALADDDDPDGSFRDGFTLTFLVYLRRELGAEVVEDIRDRALRKAERIALSSP